MADPDPSGNAEADALAAIAASMRGSFRTVQETTQAFLREAISQGVFAPGERFSQDAIASALGVSRMPVRTSIKQLEKEGLLEAMSRGVIVSVLTPAEAAEI